VAGVAGDTAGSAAVAAAWAVARGGASDETGGGTAGPVRRRLRSPGPAGGERRVARLRGAGPVPARVVRREPADPPRGGEHQHPGVPPAAAALVERGGALGAAAAEPGR